MSREAQDELILKHLDGETTMDEVGEVTQLLSDDRQFRSRFSTFVSMIASIREILDDRLSPANPGENGMSTAASAPAAEKGGFLKELNLDFRHIYFNALVGGCGGLLGWFLIATRALIFQLPSTDFFLVLVNAALTGLLVGVCIGFAIGSTEGLLASKSSKRMLKGGGYGALLGAAGGLIGLVMAEVLFNLVRGGVWPRAVGWGIFGMFVGVSEGVANRMKAKIKYGILGGLMGGMIGGATYQFIIVMLPSMGLRGVLNWGGAIGLIILGACIGFMVSLVETLLRQAWLFFLTGRLEGQTRTLDSSRPHTIGSEDSCTIVLPNDTTVRAVHAEISFVGEECEIRPRDGEVIIRRDGFDQNISSHILQPGDRVLLGETRMVFRNVEGKKS